MCACHCSCTTLQHVSAVSEAPCGMQADRALINVRNMANDLDRHSYLTALQERNESLFYKLLVDNMKELLPIVHMPTVSEYCAKYALMFRSLPRALFISLKDKGMDACSWGKLQPWTQTSMPADAALTDKGSTFDRCNQQQLCRHVKGMQLMESGTPLLAASQVCTGQKLPGF